MRRIYFDICCLNRPFDEQSQDRVRLEAEAILLILKHIETGKWRMIGGEAMELEIERNPDEERRTRVRLLSGLAEVIVPFGERLLKRAEDLERIGFRSFDALHLACAEHGSAEVVLTTDDRFINMARRNRRVLATAVVNPVSWLAEVNEK